IYTVAVLTMLPSLYLTYNMLRQSRFSANAARFVAEECRFPNTRVLSSDAEMDRDGKSLTITLIGRTLPADSLELALSARLRQYGLAGTRLEIIQGDTPSLGDIGGSSVRDIYEMAQATILSSRTTIDSLTTVIDSYHQNDTIAGRLAPEIRVLFPQVRYLAVTKAVFGEVANARLDTLDLALVTYSEPMPTAKQAEMERYLQARLGLGRVRVVNVGAQVKL
ncbi:MAG: hypothetical protein K2K72_08390, partial [Duncaniella sp.]|nr:hypothetical protein [Duncaniella sp.]